MPYRYFNNLFPLISFLFLALSLFTSCSSENNERDDATLRFFLRGKQYLIEKNYVQALRFFSEAIKADSTFAEAYNNRGIAWYGDNNFERAIQDYDKAIALLGDTVFTDAYYNKANALYELKKYDEALKNLKVVIEQYPDSAYVYLNRGTVYQQLDQLNASIEDFKKSLTLNPQNVDALVNLGTVYYLSGDTSTAITTLNEALSKNEKRHEAINTLGQIANEQARYNDALGLLNKAIKAVPAQPYYLNNRAFAKMHLGDMEGAFNDLETSLFYGKDNPWAYRNMGLYHFFNEDYDKAIEWLEKAKGSSQDVEKVGLYLGNVYQAKGELPKACEVWATDDKAKRKTEAFCNGL